MRLLYNIRRMVNLLKLKDWKTIEPFRYYLQPLLDYVTIFREELLWLHKVGPLYSRFPLVNNFNLEKKLIEAVEKDLIVQKLIETPLMQD